MAQRRFFIEKENINNNTILIDGFEHNHLKNVLRLNVSDEIIVVCGNEFDYYAKIIEINKSNTVAEIVKEEINVYNSKKNITIYQALTKNDSMYLIVQKLTELGVSSLTPITTTFTTVKDKSNKVEKLQQISNQSIKQCKRSIPLKINQTKKLTDILKELTAYDLVLFANETENTKTLKQVLSENGAMQNKKIALIVGSEGGFTSEECKNLINNGAISITLGKRILRAETASVVLATLVMYELDELN